MKAQTLVKTRGVTGSTPDALGASRRQGQARTFKRRGTHDRPVLAERRWHAVSGPGGTSRPATARALW
jgi:hypothetical protein